MCTGWPLPAAARPAETVSNGRAAVPSIVPTKPSATYQTAPDRVTVNVIDALEVVPSVSM